MRLGILSKCRINKFTLKLSKHRHTRSWKFWKDFLVNRVFMASCSSCSFTMWNIFSIGFKPGDLAGILCRVHSILSRTDNATLLFWQEQLSITNMHCLLFFGPALAKHTFSFSFKKRAKKDHPSSYAFLIFTRVVFEVNSSPFLLNAMLRHHINRYARNDTNFAMKWYEVFM